VCSNPSVRADATEKNELFFLCGCTASGLNPAGRSRGQGTRAGLIGHGTDIPWDAIATHPARDGVSCETLITGLSCSLGAGPILHPYTIIVEQDYARPSSSVSQP
jgi:hypothetical protein